MKARKLRNALLSAEQKRQAVAEKENQKIFSIFVFFICPEPWNEIRIKFTNGAIREKSKISRLCLKNKNQVWNFIKRSLVPIMVYEEFLKKFSMWSITSNILDKSFKLTKWLILSELKELLEKGMKSKCTGTDSFGRMVQFLCLFMEKLRGCSKLSIIGCTYIWDDILFSAEEIFVSDKRYGPMGQVSSNCLSFPRNDVKWKQTKWSSCLDDESGT